MRGVERYSARKRDTDIERRRHRERVSGRDRETET